MYPVGKLRFPTSLSLALDMISFHSLLGLGRDGCQSALWDCFGGRICRHVENASPKQSHNAFWQLSRHRSSAEHQSGDPNTDLNTGVLEMSKKLEWGMMKTRAESERKEMRRKTINKGILLPWIVILSKISLDKITDREQLGRSRSLHLFHFLQSLNFTLPSLFILVRFPITWLKQRDMHVKETVDGCSPCKDHKPDTSNVLSFFSSSATRWPRILARDTTSMKSVRL